MIDTKPQKLQVTRPEMGGFFKMEIPRPQQHRSDRLGIAFRDRDVDAIDQYVDATMPGLTPVDRAFVMGYVRSSLSKSLKRSELPQAAKIFEQQGNRFMLLVLSQIGWQEKYLAQIEQHIGIPLTQHRVALLLHNLDHFLHEVVGSTNPSKPIDAMNYWYRTFIREIPDPRNCVLPATHQAPRLAAQQIAATGNVIKPSPNYHDSAPFTGVCLGLAGSFKNWVSEGDAVLFPVKVRLADVFPTFSAHSPIPRALGIYPSGLFIDEIPDVPPALYSRFEVKFPSRANNSQLFARSLERMGLGSCGNHGSRNVGEVQVATNESYIVMASLAKIAGASDCRVIE